METKSRLERETGINRLNQAADGIAGAAGGNIVQSGGDQSGGDQIGSDQIGGDYKGVYASGGAPLQAVDELAEQSEFRLFEEQRNYMEVRQQAQQMAMLGQLTAEIGFLLVAGAVMLYLLGNVSVAVVSAVLSALSQALAAFFARQVDSSHDRLERYHLRLMEAQRYDAAVRLVREMEEGQAKERAVANLVGRLAAGGTQG